jgi:hydrogenase-4 component B
MDPSATLTMTLGTAFGCAAVGGIAGLVAPVRWDRAAHVAYAFGLLTCLGFVAAAYQILAGGIRLQSTLSLAGMGAADPLLQTDVLAGPLSGFFLLMLGLVGFATTLCSIGYTERYVAGRHGPFAGLVVLFLGSMGLVVVAGSVFLFLIAWEGMTLLSFLLVVHDHERAQVRRAGLTYLVIGQAATGALVFAFVLLTWATGTPAFAPMATAAPGLSELLRDGVFVAAVLGFGTKAGLVPLHVWLPEAHPAAPSNVSSLMSGLMVKMGVFGILLVVFQILGVGALWWGYVLLALGAASCLVGVLSAIGQHDVKRLLAFHSIENVGIIFLGMGAALVFLSLGWPLLAAVALLAALLHTLNHAVFKSLLFLGAGAVVGATGTRDLDELGGLARTMPRTFALFLLGALAIVALPPLNGFVSEWLLFQIFFRSFATSTLTAEVAFTASAAVLALASGLTAYCFVKVVGVAFLGQPRSEAARNVRADAPASMVAGMAVLGGSCLLLGIYPALYLSAAAPAVDAMVPGNLPSVSPWAWAQSLPPAVVGAGGSLGIGVVALILAAGLLVALGLRRGGSRPADPPAPTWDCGFDEGSPRAQITATGFAQPVVRIFERFYRSRSYPELVDRGRGRPATFGKVGRWSEVRGADLLALLYRPVARATEGFARRVSRFQSGGIHAYLAYLILTLLALLAAVRWLGGGTP